ncbi:hypothetical protein DPMN_041616 [Dreissena polymorpha]|uniref:Uncharacterized protein n=1 Tax=Dreissena polymorpha TaxID=45954 RepID=A0A9D4CZD7_DREPO|nr:hypothetical protein DPMN_041616 [Dreissena polymorpha]
MSNSTGKKDGLQGGSVPLVEVLYPKKTQLGVNDRLQDKITPLSTTWPQLRVMIYC